MNTDPLYREDILDHARASPYRGRLEHPDLAAELSNLTCGDRVRLEMRVAPTGRVLAVRFDGEGCALSQAAASMLAERIDGATLAEARRFSSEAMLGLLAGVYLTPVRARCWLLAWRAMQAALAQEPGPIED
jgi:nitrogen fixation NifU-like protein